jgi:hypothetical protein
MIRPEILIAFYLSPARLGIAQRRSKRRSGAETRASVSDAALELKPSCRRRRRYLSGRASDAVFSREDDVIAFRLIGRKPGTALRRRARRLSTLEHSTRTPGYRETIPR